MKQMQAMDSSQQGRDQFDAAQNRWRSIGIAAVAAATSIRKDGPVTAPRDATLLRLIDSVAE